VNGGCTCECHVRPGVYPTSEARPCGVCGHVDAHGQWVCGAWGPHGNYRPAEASRRAPDGPVDWQAMAADIAAVRLLASERAMALDEVARLRKTIADQADLFEARAAEVREEEFYGAREGAEDLRWAAASLREELTPTATPGSTPR